MRTELGLGRLTTVAIVVSLSACSSATEDPTGSATDAIGRSHRSLIFRESFEHGTSRWTTKDGVPIDVEYEPRSTSYQHETLATGYGRAFVARGIPVQGGDTYCVGAYVRGTPALYPFLGVWLSDAIGRRSTEHWMIGMAGYTTAYADQAVTAVSLDGEWHWLTTTFTVEPEAQYVVVGDELFAYDGKESGLYADFDEVRLYHGSCPCDPPGRWAE